MINTIGPVWDGNEVWLLVAGGATFAAFPEWYATLFSGFYLPLLPDPRRADRPRASPSSTAASATTRPGGAAGTSRSSSGQLVPALLWGVAFANIVRGVPIDADHEFTGDLFTCSTRTRCSAASRRSAVPRPRRRLPGAADEARSRTSRQSHRRAAPVAAVLVAAFLAWTVIRQSDRGGIELVSTLLAVLAGVSLVGAAAFAAHRPGRAFAATSLSIVFLFSSLFANLFPNAMVSSTNSAYDLTLSAASSSHYTLTVMTVVAVALVPLVLLYQGWTYWVFRARLGAEDFGEVKNPLDLVDRRSRTGHGQ